MDLRAQLPRVPVANGPELVGWLQRGFAAIGHEVRLALTTQFDALVSTGVIKAYRDQSERSYYFKHPGGTSHDVLDPQRIGMVDLTQRGEMHVAYVAFEIALAHNGPCRAPTSKSYAKPAFLKVQAPWEVLLHSAETKRLKTQDNFRFRAFFKLRLPLLPRDALPDPKTCLHDFRILDLGAWEWRLVWECRLCGYECHCRCFEQAIHAVPYRQPDLERRGRSLGIKSGEVPFHDGACEVCRGVASTHVFCHKMYARSLFEQRYGAYVAKRKVEMQLEGGFQGSPEELDRLATNEVRQALGFKAIGERFVTETELYRIVKTLFPNDEVIHHYRADWLAGLELDVYVPNYGLAIEYQGVQHFQPVEAWGGDAALATTRERDAKKAELCREQGVKLVYFKYDEEVTLELVRERINLAGLHGGGTGLIQSEK